MASASFQHDIATLRANCLEHGTTELRGCCLIGLPLSGDGITESIADARRSFVRPRLPSKINKRTLQAADIPPTVLVLSVADELKVAKRGTVSVNVIGMETEFAVLLVSNDTMAKVHGRETQQAEQFAKFTAFCDQAELVFASRCDELSASGIAVGHWLGWLFAVAVAEPGLCSVEGNGIRTVSKLWLAALEAIDQLADACPQKAVEPSSAAVHPAAESVEAEASELDRICGFLRTPLQIRIVKFLWGRRFQADLDAFRDTCWQGRDVLDTSIERQCERINALFGGHIAISVSLATRRVSLEVVNKNFGKP